MLEEDFINCELNDEGVDDFCAADPTFINEAVLKDEEVSEVGIDDINEDIDDSLEEAKVYAVKKMDKDQGEDVAIELARFDKAELANKKSAEEKDSWVEVVDEDIDEI